MALFEKYIFSKYIKVNENEILNPTKYFKTMNELAKQSNFINCGWYKDIRGGIYAITLSMWMNNNLDTLIIIGGGKILKKDYKKSMCVSFCNNEKIIVTYDECGSIDLSGLLDIELLLNADLEELISKHQERNTEFRSLKILSPENALKYFEDIDKLRAEKLIDEGLAKYYDMRQSGFTYTLKGAFFLASTGFLAQLKKANKQSDRLSLHRPGDRGYQIKNPSDNL